MRHMFPNLIIFQYIKHVITHEHMGGGHSIIKLNTMCGQKFFFLASCITKMGQSFMNFLLWVDIHDIYYIVKDDFHAQISYPNRIIHRTTNMEVVALHKGCNTSHLSLGVQSEGETCGSANKMYFRNVMYSIHAWNMEICRYRNELMETTRFPKESDMAMHIYKMTHP